MVTNPRHDIHFNIVMLGWANPKEKGKEENRLIEWISS